MRLVPTTATMRRYPGTVVAAAVLVIVLVVLAAGARATLAAGPGAAAIPTEATATETDLGVDRDRTAAPSPAVPATTAPSAAAETWAVVVGADRYHGHEVDLGAGIADAEATVTALERAFAVDRGHRRVLLGDAATTSALSAALAWLVEVAGPEDQAVVFYAGHVRHLGGTTQALLLPDGTLVHDTELALALAPLRAGATWLPIAGCYAAGFDELLAPGRVLTAAAGADSLSYENRDLGNSYLVEYVMERQLATGDATTVDGAVAAATLALARDYPDRLPVQLDRLAGEFTRL